MTKPHRYLAFIYILFCTGFTLGTLTLSLMIESLLSYMHREQWMTDYENIMVIGIILIYLVYSFFIALWLTSTYLKFKTWSSRIIFLLILTLTVVASLWYWLSPKALDKKTEYIVSADGRFIAGPYPDKAKMLELKRENYTAIISLLSPYVVPFEPILMEKEEAVAKETGVPIINLPMLPWITKNADSIKKIETLAKEDNNNKYYVHCYYGRDRVSMFMRVVDASSPKVASRNPDAKVKHVSGEKLVQMERGMALAIDDHIIFGPTPTEDELTYYILNVKNPIFSVPIRNIVIVRTDRPISQGELQLKNFGVNIDTFEINDYPYQTEKILEFAQQLKKMTGPIFVYSFYAEPRPRSIVLEGLMLSYLSNLPSIPKQVFDDAEMQNGEIEMIAPNILIGSKPSEKEYSDYLYYRGIRSIAYIGDCNSDDAKAEENNAAKAKLKFNCFNHHDPALIQTISVNGPWYVFGLSDEEEDKLEKQFAKTIPNLNPYGVEIIKPQGQ